MSPLDLVDAVLDTLCNRYVFPDTAVAASVAVRRRCAAGAYDGLTEHELAVQLTSELYALCADKHLRVRVRDGDRTRPPGEARLSAAQREQARQGNYGIARVERLDGNVGYLDLRQVTEASMGGRAIAAAMELVAHTDALIIDLRRNRGGTPNGANVWVSYLLADDGTHLNTVHDGAVDRQYWSLAYLPGERYLDRPVWVLTSDATFSAAEEICYTLQALGRATVVGQTTRGGAHPCEVVPLTATVEITVPVARSVNPLTGTNWEGVGVTPDIEVPAAQALTEAYRRALRHVLAASPSARVADEARTALRRL